MLKSTNDRTFVVPVEIACVTYAVVATLFELSALPCVTAIKFPFTDKSLPTNTFPFKDTSPNTYMRLLNDTSPLTPNFPFNDASPNTINLLFIDTSVVKFVDPPENVAPFTYKEFDFKYKLPPTLKFPLKLTSPATPNFAFNETSWFIAVNPLIAYVL